jgi:hypothetical protein
MLSNEEEELDRLRALPTWKERSGQFQCSESAIGPNQFVYFLYHNHRLHRFYRMSVWNGTGAACSLALWGLRRDERECFQSMCR